MRLAGISFPLRTEISSGESFSFTSLPGRSEKGSWVSGSERCSASVCMCQCSGSRRRSLNTLSRKGCRLNSNRSSDSASSFLPRSSPPTASGSRYGPEGGMGGSELWRGGLQHPEGLVGGGEVHDGSVVRAGHSMDTFLLCLGRDCRNSTEWTFFSFWFFWLESNEISVPPRLFKPVNLM